MTRDKMSLYNLLPAPEKARLGILELIKSGEIPSGHRIDQRNIAKKLELTTAPIREALSSLETEGFLQRVPGVGIFCKAYTVDEIEEIIEIRGVLEGLAARRAAARISPAQKQDLLDMGEKLSSPDYYTDQKKYLQAHIEFHTYIAKLSDSQQLIMLLERNFIIQQVLSNISAHIWPIEPHDHLTIAKAISTGDPVKAEKATKDHIIPSFQSRLNKLRAEYRSDPILSRQ